MYDVFLSYNREDQPAVEAVAHALRDRGLNPFIDRWYLKPGQSWTSALEKNLNDCKAAAIFIGPGRLGRWQQREKDLALDRQATEPEFPVIPVLLPGGDPALGFLKLNTWVDLRSGQTADTIEMLVRAIRREPPGADLRERAALAVATICPYRGLLPFREEDEPFFCGRQAFTDKLVDAVAERNLVAVVGASGSGKSSVVYAGLIPRLRRAARKSGKDGYVWDMVTVLPHDRPLHALAERFVSLLEPEIGEIERLSAKKSLAEKLMSGDIELRDVVERALAKQPGTDRLLLVVDQWEELYTLCKDAPERQQFIAQVLRATSFKKLTVVMTLRGDFVGHALGNRELSDRLQDGQVNIAPMTREELRSVIVEPAEKVSLHFEDGLVDRILGDVGDEPGRLPLLEFLLAELWEKRQGNLLEHDVYNAIGGVSGAIAKRAEDSFERLKSQEQEQLHWAMVRLVAPGQDAEDTRRRAALTELDPAAHDVIAKLASDRLLVTTRDKDGGEVVEVSHEALIREWPRLKKWVDENRQNLRTLAKLEDEARTWRAERSDYQLLLPPGRRLAEAEELVKAMPRAIGPLVKAYVDASAAWHKTQQEKALLRSRLIAAAATVLMIIASGAAYYGFDQAGQAAEQAKIAAAHAAEAKMQKEYAEQQTVYANEQAAKAKDNFAVGLGATTKILDAVKANLNNGLISAQVAKNLLEDAENVLAQLHQAAPDADVAIAQIELLFAISDVYTKLGKLGDANDRAIRAGSLATTQLQANRSDLRWVRAQYGSHFRLGDNLAALGRLTDAAEEYQHALDVAMRIAQAEPSSRAQFNLSFISNKIGDIAKIRGDVATALRRYLASLEIIEQVDKDDPNKPEWLRQLAATHTWVGDALAALGNADESIDHHWTSLKIRQKLSDQQPGHAGLRSNLATSYARLGEAYAARGEYDGALSHYRTSLKLRRQNVEQDQTNLESVSQLAYSHIYIGDVLKAKGDVTAALAEYNSALRLRQALAKLQTGSQQNQQWQENIAIALVRIGDAKLADDPAGAAEKYRESLVVLEPLSKMSKGSVSISRNIFISHVMIGDALVAQSKKKEAVDEYRAALAAIRPIVLGDSSMTGPGWRISVPAAHNKLALVLRDQDDLEGALKEHQIVQRMVREHAARIPEKARLWDAVESHRGMAVILAAMDKLEVVSQELAAARELLDQLSLKDPNNKLVQIAIEEVALAFKTNFAGRESRPVTLPPEPKP